uniref:Uracil-DNA glycosylase (Trinotate prediction) n=1 Tax=Myxobolus squamalis TaxID=59785 RepID=A0A6B2FZT4_MYXSQ
MSDTENLKSYFAPEKRTESECVKNFDCKIKNSIEENEGTDETDNKNESEQEEADYAIPGTEGMGLSWKNALKEEFKKDYFLKVIEFVKCERLTKTIYPQSW